MHEYHLKQLEGLPESAIATATAIADEFQLGLWDWCQTTKKTARTRREKAAMALYYFGHAGASVQHVAVCASEKGRAKAMRAMERHLEQAMTLAVATDSEREKNRLL